MFQIGGLIVFCGLLALPLPVDLALSPTDVAGELTSAVSSGLLSGGLLDSVKNLPLVDILKTNATSSGGLIGKLLQQVINPLKGLTGIEITEPKLLEIGLVPSEDGHRLYLNIPLSFKIKLQLLTSKLRLLTLSVKLNATIELIPKKEEDGLHLVLGDCSRSPVNLEITLPDGAQIILIQPLINDLTNTLTKTLPKLLLVPVCSLVNGLLSQLDVSLVQNIVDTLIPQKDIIIDV
ncbi:BPI fold containing family A member 1 [Phyllostomus discolor]|uniref:BPI fold-containing family A member 1 n=1 Tax=Phyllostomus discolor TaxID=89673 RepID=A0A6J2MLJ7_9CHIR|nr:BPI fold-containing family A member 1 [Phyllostomus discolor]KAF6087437.1 BPI fold containing family A member 1 [Phyllostomus discolor]